MRLCMFSPAGMDLERGWPGRIDGEQVVQLAAQTLEAFFTGGGTAREHAVYPLDEVELRAPVMRPRNVRSFAAFVDSDAPYFSFGNACAVLGPDADVPYPDGVSELDYGLALAAVIGADGAIGGFTVMNAWAARDLEPGELGSGLGPSKSRDFAISLGPVLVTPDEFDGSAGLLEARVNGDGRSWANLRDMYHSWAGILAHAARNTKLRPGEVIGSGDAGSIRSGGGDWLAPGDLVELEVEGVGVLRNRIAAGV